MTSLREFWPPLEHVSECVRTEAEVVDEAVLLAVHEPGALVRRSANGATTVPATEDDLLNELMRDASDGSAVLVAITGDSGVGKSHLVRWLHAQLTRHPRSKELAIVVVPKTASLRQVVERMLAPLEDSTRDRLLAELGQTVDHLRPSDAAAMLNTAISLHLQQKYAEGMASLQQGGREVRSVRERLELTKKLGDLIREPEVFDHWLGRTLERIVRLTLSGGSEQQTGDRRRFLPSDLELPTAYEPDTRRASINAALLALSRNDGANRPLAAEILQEALDPALRDVFKFSQALGARTIEEIVDDIRQQLLREGKDLVLLIEDFAALAGIQQPLLNLMIAESDHAGVRVRAPIRTALAVTDGFLPSRQTILTRAKQEWLIPNTAATPGAIVDRLVALAGRYLNAARWGAPALRKRLARRHDPTKDSWVKPFPAEMTDEDARMLSAFGESEAGYPLFPLSRHSIETMAMRELSSGGGLRFNPRAFINILREVLAARPLFEESKFPPPFFKSAAPKPAVQLALGQRGLPPDVQDRMGTVLALWAGNPASLSDPPTVGQGLFEAFELPWPFTGSAVVPPVPKSTRKRDTTSDPAPVAAEVPSPSLGYLDAWATGSIDQRDALRVRKLLAAALKNRLDWSHLRVKARTIEPGHIWLPFASVGNPANEPRFEVARETRPLDPVLLAGVAALEKWSDNRQSWDYSKSEETDYPAAQQLLDRIEALAVEWHLGAAQRQAGVALKVLHRQSLLLRLTRAADPAEHQLAQYFADPPVRSWSPDEADNRPAATVARLLVRAEESRSTVRDVLANAVGCFQGEGSILMGVDPRRTRAGWKQPIPEAGALVLGAQLGKALTAVDDVLGRIEPNVRKLASAIGPVVVRIQAQLGDVADTMPPAVFQDPLERARLAGLFAHVNAASFDQARQAMECLSSEGARQLIKQAMQFATPEADAVVEKRLLAWSTFELEVVAKVESALDLLARLLPELERAASAELRTHAGADVGAMLSELRGDLTLIATEQSR